MESKYNTKISRDGFEMQLQAELLGKDLTVYLTGGDHPHIGALTTIDKSGNTKDIAFPSHDGRLHKDGVLSRQVIQVIKENLPGVCVVSAGVHVDHISQKQLKATSPMTVELAVKLKKWLENNDISISEPKYYGQNEHPQ